MAMKDDEKQAIALWRIGVLGPLVSARLDHGDRRAYFEEAAARTHQLPDGTFVELSARTIESWYYAYKRGGFKGLWPETRADCQTSRSIQPDVADFILRAKREKPRRSLNRIIRILERARVVRAGELKRSSVHRLLAVHDASARPLRGPSAERRSFIHEHTGDLWVGDALHGPLVIAPDGQVRKAYLLSQIDGATRFIPYSYFAVSEDAPAQEYGLKQAILRHGPPRKYYVDLGAAYIALSLKLICAELGIHLLHTGKRDCEAKGVIERWHATWRAEVGDELPAHPLPLAELNSKHWAWLAVEYNARVHATTQRVPREHWLGDVEHARRLPHDIHLDEVFLHREKRTVRKDGTVRFRGQYLEVHPTLVGEVELRFDPADEHALPRVFQGGRFVCDTVRLDRLRNATRARRRFAGEPEPGAAPTGLDALALMEAEHYERVRPLAARSVCEHDDDDDDTDDMET
jgi:transposase InsO family protein